MTALAAPRRWRWHAVLLVLWFAASFAGVFFVRDLDRLFSAGWLSFWFAAQGLVLVFLAIVVAYAWLANRNGRTSPGFDAVAYARHTRRFHYRMVSYVVALLLFILALAWAESRGLPKAWVAGVMLVSSVLLYAAVGVYGRTSNAAEYYVAGRRIPAFYNGMATAADWMSAASFISLAGSLYLQGFSGAGQQPGGLAYILGWTGGFCLVALLVAPYLRRMHLYTLPDYFEKRFGGRWPRIISALAAIVCSFTYVVAQIYGVGLITSRLTGVHFEVGIVLALGGVLVCSFLGGMRAVTWTQVTQYAIIILAFLIPVSWLSYQQTGNPFAPLAYVQQLSKITAMEQDIIHSSAEKEVLQEYARRALELDAMLKDPEGSLQLQRTQLLLRIRALDGHPDSTLSNQLRRQLAALPKDNAEAQSLWRRQRDHYLQRSQPLAGMPPHAQAFAGDPQGTEAEKQAFNTSRLNFLALMFCLMVGTAGLPHLLTRYYTTPTVAETRRSVAWSLFFIALLYLSVPALAVLVKYEVMAHLVGQPLDALPQWMAAWSRDPTLLLMEDVNGDQILQFAELEIGADLVMLASAEIGGLPYIVSVLVAAGGLAAALSTADGLLLTMGNAFTHDLYFAGNKSGPHEMQRVMWSKFALLLVALVAAYVAAQRPAGILYLVSASFSLAGAALVPAMVLGIFWRGTTRAGAVAGMLAGLGVTVYYMVVNLPLVRQTLGLQGTGLWWGIQPVSAGVFGVLAGVLVVVGVSSVPRWRRGGL